MDNELRLERLRKLRAVVNKHARAHGRAVRLDGVTKGWDMQVWCCNTSACALGSYALTPEGRKYFRMIDVNGRDIDLRGPQGGNAIAAAARHFGISESNAYRLFIPGAYPDPHDITPKQVLKRIDELIDKYSA